MRAARLALFTVLAACGDDHVAPKTYVLANDNVRVVVTEIAPFSYHIRDTAGRLILASAGDGTGDGYGAIGFTHGTADLRTTISPGYFKFDFALEPWRDAWEVSGVQQTPSALAVLLRKNADTVTLTFTLRERAVRVEARTDGAPRAWEASFATPADEGFMGLGERFTRTNFRGLAMYSWAEEGGIGSREGDVPGPHNPYPNGESMSYYPVPFFLSTHGYGFWLDTTWWNEYDLAIDKPDVWRVWTIAPTLDFEVYVGDRTALAPWPYSVIDQFTARTGRPMVPPAWAFGPRRRMGHGTMIDGVLEVQRMRDEDLAITGIDDAVHFNPGGVSAEQAAGLAAVIPRTRALGYRVIGYFNSFFETREDAHLHDEMVFALEHGYFVSNAAGEPAEVFLITGTNLVNLYMIDFTDPDATAWYVRRFDRALDLGYSGWMYDFGEYVPAGAVAHSGITGEELHNLYPVLYQKAAHDYLEAGPHAGDWMTFVRSGYTGASQYSPLTWGGDPAGSFETADGLPSMVRGGINMGISGVPMWGGDIGGYHCVTDGAALADGGFLARWIQQGALNPNMHDQNACVGGDTALKATIWKSPEAKEAWRVWARVNTRLAPYLHGLACQAHATGAPLIRHVFLEHPDRVDWAGVDDVHYLGPALFVAPVVERGAREKSFELPPGGWVEWPEGRLVYGGERVTLAAPLSKIPVLLRDGYLVPLLDPTIDTLAEEESADIIGPGDVSTVYDVVGALGPLRTARFEFCDGGSLVANRSAPFTAPDLPLAENEAELATCAGCYLVTELENGLTRVRISATGAVTAGGLTVTSTNVNRRIRWDLYLLPSLALP